jgi:hypothetical protein
MHHGLLFHWLENDADLGLQSLCDTAQGAEGVAFVACGLQATDLLLGSLDELCQVLLGKPGTPTKSSDLQCHVPGLADTLKSSGKVYSL